MVLRRGPQTGLAYLPTADARFRRNERLRLELPTSAAAAPATARFLDRTGKPLQAAAAVTIRNEAGTGVTWIVVDSPVSPFAAGDYLVEVTQEGASQMVAFRVVT